MIRYMKDLRGNDRRKELSVRLARVRRRAVGFGALGQRN